MKIEINIGKKHFWAIIGVMVLLAITTIVVAKTTTPAYTDDQPFHETLYTDVIAGKTADKVVVDDDTEITGDAKFDKTLYTDIIAGKTADKVTIDGDLNVVGKNSGKKVFISGNSVGSNDVQVGSSDSGIDTVSLFNPLSGKFMNLHAWNIKLDGTETVFPSGCINGNCGSGVGYIELRCPNGGVVVGVIISQDPNSNGDESGGLNSFDLICK